MEMSYTMKNSFVEDAHTVPYEEETAQWCGTHRSCCACVNAHGYCEKSRKA